MRTTREMDAGEGEDGIARGLAVHWAGLPLRSMCWYEGTGTAWLPEGAWNPLGEVVLPRRVVWLGFVVDTCLFAALGAGAWWSLLLVAGVARRRFRRAEGACPRCGYDLSGLRGEEVRCPECGRVG
jgi:hypothetical protein